MFDHDGGAARRIYRIRLDTRIEAAAVPRLDVLDDLVGEFLGIW
ncbi:MAG: hypothetical protein ACRDQ5_02095 [Sciscionella sp.]